MSYAHDIILIQVIVDKIMQPFFHILQIFKDPVLVRLFNERPYFF